MQDDTGSDSSFNTLNFLFSLLEIDVKLETWKRETRTCRTLHCFHLPYDFDSIYCIVCLFCANIKMSRINFFALLNFPEIQDNEKRCFRGQRSKNQHLWIFFGGDQPFSWDHWYPCLIFGWCLRWFSKPGWTSLLAASCLSCQLCMILLSVTPVNLLAGRMATDKIFTFYLSPFFKLLLRWLTYRKSTANFIS